MQSLAVNGYSAAEVIKALHAPSRVLAFSYELLNSTNQVLRQLSTVLSASVSYNSLAQIKGTAKFKLKDTQDINFLSDRIKPYVRLKMPAKTIDAAAQPTFTRASVAYKQDGTQVAANVPRYEAGQFGQAVMVEEGTTNLLTNASFEIYTGTNGVADGWGVESYPGLVTAPAVDTTYHRNSGNKSQKLTISSATGGGNADCFYEISTTAGIVYTLSAYVKTTSIVGIAKAFIYMEYFDVNNTNLGNTQSVAITTVSDWQRLTVTATTPANTAKVQAKISINLSTSTDNIVVYFDDVQLEQKAYATSAVIAADTTTQAARTAESLTIPTVGVVNSQQGTVEFWLYPQSFGGLNNYLGIGGTAGLTSTEDINSYQVYHLSDGKLYARWGTGSATVSASSTIGQLVLNQWTLISISWQANGTLDLYVNGQPANSVSLGALSPSLTFGNIYIGLNRNGVSGAQSLIDDLRISSIARTDAEILAAYQSNAPLPVDEYTTAKLSFDGSLTAKTYQGPGWAEWAQGVYLLSTPTRIASLGVVTRDISAYDQNQILLDDKVTGRYTVTSGTNYITAVKTLLELAGITLYNLTPSTKTLDTDRDWEPGTPKYTIINNLLDALNYTSLYFDGNGYAVAQPYVSPQVRAAEYSYKDDDESVILPQVEQTLDLFKIPNKWVLTCSEPDRSPLVSTYTNSNPDSLTSTISRGRVIVDFRNNQEAADQVSLDAKTQRIAFEASQVYEQVQFESGIMPFHGHSDVLSMYFTDLGISYKYGETSWGYELKAGAKMKHQIRRVVNI